MNPTCANNSFSNHCYTENKRWPMDLEGGKDAQLLLNFTAEWNGEIKAWARYKVSKTYEQNNSLCALLYIKLWRICTTNISSEKINLCQSCEQAPKGLQGWITPGDKNSEDTTRQKEKKNTPEHSERLKRRSYHPITESMKWLGSLHAC